MLEFMCNEINLSTEDKQYFKEGRLDKINGWDTFKRENLQDYKKVCNSIKNGFLKSIYPGYDVLVNPILFKKTDFCSPAICIGNETSNGVIVLNDEDQIMFNPKVVIEVVYSSLDGALAHKLNFYEKLGIKEYEIINISDRQVISFELGNNGLYQLVDIDNLSKGRLVSFPTKCGNLTVDMDVLYRITNLTDSKIFKKTNLF